MKGERSNLTRKMRLALSLLEGQEYGVVTSGETALIDRQPWIHWRTAYALADRGLAIVTQVDVGEWEIRLPSPLSAPVVRAPNGNGGRHEH